MDLNNQIGEVRVKQDFGANWQLNVAVLNQIADRNINTAVNSFIPNTTHYHKYRRNLPIVSRQRVLRFGPALPG